VERGDKKKQIRNGRMGGGEEREGERKKEREE